MSHRTSRSTSGALEGVDLSAVQANLRALGHDVDEAQLVVMLQDINIGQLLSRASRPGTAASLAGRRSEASSSTQRSVSMRTASIAQPSHASERSVQTMDGNSDGSSAALYSHISQTSASSASASLRHSGAYNSASGGPGSSTDDQARFLLGLRIVKPQFLRETRQFGNDYKLCARHVQSLVERRQRSSHASTSRQVAHRSSRLHRNSNPAGGVLAKS